jgi:predicted transcriptional regulator of viral defense system
MSNDVAKSLSAYGRVVLTRLAQKSLLFTVQDAYRARKEAGFPPSKQSVRDLLSDLTERGWIHRLKRGKYAIVPLEAGPEGAFAPHEYLVATSLVEPAVISHWSALQYHNLTEQVSRTVFVSTTKQHRDVETLGTQYHFIRFPEKRFFGHSPLWVEGQRVMITDIERTILDCFDRPAYSGGIGEAVKGLWEARSELDWAKLTDYLLKFGNGAVLKRIGVLAETWHLPVDWLQVWRTNLSLGFTLLDPQGPPQGARDHRWRVILNAQIPSQG